MWREQGKGAVLPPATMAPALFCMGALRKGGRGKRKRNRSRGKARNRSCPFTKRNREKEEICWLTKRKEQSSFTLWKQAPGCEEGNLASALEKEGFFERGEGGAPEGKVSISKKRDLARVKKKKGRTSQNNIFLQIGQTKEK